MTWTYIPADLATVPLYQVRFYCGDTDTTDQQVQDEEIAWLLTEAPSPTLAAAMVCEHLSRKFSRLASKTIGHLSIQAAERASAYARRGSELRTQDSVLAMPFCGGLSISGKDTLDLDADAVQPSFRRGMDDNPRAGSEDVYPLDGEE